MLDVADRDLDDRDDGEQQQADDLDGAENDLHVRRDLGADHADRRGQRDVRDRERRDRRRRDVAESMPEDAVRVDRGDVASEPITSTPVMQTAQPEIQPLHGPSAFVTHVNVVPQSGSARFM